jgi:uncharacterized repeat protein (TIGR03803 family)
MSMGVINYCHGDRLAWWQMRAFPKAHQPFGVGLLVLICGLAPCIRGQTLEILQQVRMGTTGKLIQASDGFFYGRRVVDGVIFRMTAEGGVTDLVNPGGSHESGALVEARDGSFYGTTAAGGASGYGMVFKMTAAGNLTPLANFDGANGSYPEGALMQGSDGNFYGTTYSGGDLTQGNGRGLGTVFKMTPEGALTTLVKFKFTNGALPNAGLIEGCDGDFYGTTESGGTFLTAKGSYQGTIFKVTPNGTLTTLVKFNYSNGSDPRGALVQGSDGNFYGTTATGGAFGNGTVFKMTPAGALTTLVSFESNGEPWTELALGRDGNFYGVTWGASSGERGSVFRVTPSGKLSTLIDFAGSSAAEPEVAVTFGRDGNLYGSTYAGSAGGTIFRIIMPPLQPASLPPLQIVRSGDSILLSWPATAGSSILEMASTLARQTWMPLQTVPVQIGDEQVVTVDITSENQFFRLRK